MTEPNNLDALADQLAALPEDQAQAVIRKARTKDTTTKQRNAADKLQQYLTGHTPAN
jgi:hypothetical protein